MSAFLAGLGAALSTGSALSGRRRQERRQEELDRQNREQQVLQMALAQRSADLQERSADLAERSFAGQEQDRARDFARDLISQIGPEGVVDDTAASAIEAGGLGSRLGALQTQTAPDPVSMQSIQLEGLPQQRTLTATPMERIQLDATRRDQAEKDRFAAERERAREAISLPGYDKSPELTKAVLWQKAGFDGQVPMSVAEWQARQDYEHKLRLAEIGAQGANQLAAANARSSGSAPKRMPLGMINQFTELDDAIAMAAQMRDSHIPGSTGTLPKLGAMAPNWFTEGTARLVPDLVEPGGFGNAAKQRQAAIALAKQIIGKGLEGGVLRKEDEAKYEAILPTIYDPDDVVKAKLQGLINRLQERRDVYSSNAEIGGYELPDTRNNGRLNNGITAQMPGATPGARPDPMNLFGPK